MRRSTKKYKAMGFLESLIAIIVIGIASAVLMGIAANALRDAVENERIDKMTQFAIEGLNMTEIIIQEMIEENKDIREELDLTLVTTENCFVPEEIPPKFSFKINSFLPDKLFYIAGDRPRDTFEQAPETGITIDAKTEYFRVACIKKPNNKYLNVRIWVGHKGSSGNFTGRNNVKDYVYSTIIPL